MNIQIQIFAICFLMWKKVGRMQTSLCADEGSPTREGTAIAEAVPYDCFV
jgi:hypothetical protein